MLIEELVDLKKQADYVKDVSLNFTHPDFSDVHPEWSSVFSFADSVEELMNKLIAEKKSNTTEGHKVLAKNLTLSGYGEKEEVILGILSKLTEEELNALNYNYYRTAEKLGSDALAMDEVFER